MSENMVERVAGVIKDNIQAVLPDGVIVDYHYAACAAIEAMKEPTDEMIDNGRKAQRRFDSRFETTNCIEIWDEMLDAALTDNQPA